MAGLPPDGAIDSATIRAESTTSEAIATVGPGEAAREPSAATALTDAASIITAATLVSSTAPSALSEPSDSVERLATIKDRLTAISSKHSARRKSTESATILSSIASPKRMSESSLSSFRLSPTPSDPESVLSEQLAANALRRRSSLVALVQRLKAPVTIPSERTFLPRDKSCSCVNVIPLDGDSSAPVGSSTPLNEPTICQSCKAQIRPIFKILQERSRLMDQLVEARKQLDHARVRDDNTTRETGRMLGRVEELEDLMDAKAEEVQRLRRDLSAMSEKVVDEIEKRAELQASKDVLQDELEELTKSLFEQANVLVADEARRRHHHEVREKSLEQDLQDLKVQLQREQMQLRELKTKMEEAQLVEMQESAFEAVASAVALGSNSSSASGPPNPVDSMLFSEFKEFMAQAPTVKPNRLHTLTFMKNSLEDDITPCLRFGGNPRTSTRRLIDSIAAGSCFVEEMAPAQMAAIQSQHQALKDAQAAAAAAVAAAIAGTSTVDATGAVTDPLRRTRTFVPSSSAVPYAPPLPSYTLSSGSFSAGSSNSGTPPRTASPQLSQSSLAISSAPPPPSHFLLPEREKQLQALAASPTQAIFQKTMLERISTWTTGSSGSNSTKASGTSPSSSSSSSSSTASSNASAGGSASTTSTVANFPALPPSLVLMGCSTCGRTPVATPHRFKITDNPEDHYCPICQACRDRLVAVCDFYNFVRNARKGLHSSRRAEDLYLEVMGMKRKMFYARIGCGKVGEAGGGWTKAVGVSAQVALQAPTPAAKVS